MTELDSMSFSAISNEASSETRLVLSRCTSAERLTLAESRLEMISARNHEVGVSKCNLAKQIPLQDRWIPQLKNAVVREGLLTQ
jgi:hypothetical protein